MTVVEPVAARGGSISWAAILAGAVVAIAVSITLSIAAAGVGYAAGYEGFVSPGSLSGFTREVGAGAMVIQVLSAALGGYLTGRLRPHWADVDLHESHFRDTAHGLVTWAVASGVGLVVAAPMLASIGEGVAAAQAMAAPADASRIGSLAAQSALFVSVGLLLSAFTSAVAARLGGQQVEGVVARLR